MPTRSSSDCSRQSPKPTDRDRKLSRNRSRPTAFRHRALRCLRKPLPFCSKRNAQTVCVMSLDARLVAWCRGVGYPGFQRCRCRSLRYVTFRTQGSDVVIVATVAHVDLRGPAPQTKGVRMHRITRILQDCSAKLTAPRATSRELRMTTSGRSGFPRLLNKERRRDRTCHRSRRSARDKSAWQF